VISKPQVEGSGGATKGSAASFGWQIRCNRWRRAQRGGKKKRPKCPPSNREIDRHAQGEVVDIVTLAARERLDSNAISFLEGN
jgi:hypothetical protein